MSCKKCACTVQAFDLSLYIYIIHKSFLGILFGPLCLDYIVYICAQTARPFLGDGMWHSGHTEELNTHGLRLLWNCSHGGTWGNFWWNLACPSGYAVGRAFVEFFGNGMGEDFVKWKDQDSASLMWLILLVARTVMLLGVHTCLWNMVYEWYCEPTARFARNPYYIYDAEKALIRFLLNYVLLVGLSMWFFNTIHFKILTTVSQRALLSTAFCVAVLTLCYTLRVLEYLMFKERLEGKSISIFIGWCTFETLFFFGLFLAALWECTEVLERGHDGTSFYEDRDEDRKENGPILWGVGGAFWQVVKMCICGVGERDRHFRRWMLLMLLMSTNLLNLNWRKQVSVCDKICIEVRRV